MKRDDKHHEAYMREALVEAEKALHMGEFPVGCVIVDHEGVICSGSREKSAQNNELEHAEIRAVRKLYHRFPHKVGSNLTVYATMEPCLMCYSTLILNNIRTIAYAYEDAMGGGTTMQLSSLRPLYATMKVEIVDKVLRNDSLRLFKKFFSNPDNTYLQGSLLAQYTLAQQIR